MIISSTVVIITVIRARQFRQGQARASLGPASGQPGQGVAKAGASDLEENAPILSGIGYEAVCLYVRCREINV